MTDYYEILEVAPSATQEEIRSAYIRLALKHHPDRNPLPDSGEIFKQIADAYYTLSDPSRKAEYDKARGSSTPYSPGQVSTTSVFGSVFDELLKPEMDNAPSFYGPVGAVAGGILGFIIMNVPGAIAGTYFGNSMGKIRDRNGMSVYDAFCSLEQSKRHDILIQLGQRMFNSIL